MGRDTAYWYRRGRGCLWAKAECHVESKRELEAYVNGDRGLEH